MQLRKVGYKFSQIGGAFLVHYPHSSSKARREWNKVAAADGGKRLPSETLNSVRPVGAYAPIFFTSFVET